MAASEIRSILLPVFQYLFKSFDMRLLDLEFYRLVSPTAPDESLVEVCEIRELSPCNSFLVVAPFEKDGRIVEFHAKYRVDARGELVEEYFQIVRSEIFPGEDTAKIELESMPTGLKESLNGIISDLIYRRTLRSG